MSLLGLTGKGLSTLQGKSPGRSLHWLLITWWLPLTLTAPWVGSPSPGGKAPGQRYKPLKEGGPQETLRGQPVRSLPQAPNQGAALTTRRAAQCQGDTSHHSPATATKLWGQDLGPHGSWALKHDAHKANNVIFFPLFADLGDTVDREGKRKKKKRYLQWAFNR